MIDLGADGERLAEYAHRWPRQMAEITDILATELATACPELLATHRAIAGRLMAALAGAFGGGYVYIPKGDALERLLRDSRMWAEYDGTVEGPGGVMALARKYQLSDIYVWKVLSNQRELHRHAYQPGLFDKPNAD